MIRQLLPVEKSLAPNLSLFHLLRYLPQKIQISAPWSSSNKTPTGLEKFTNILHSFFP